MQGLALYESQLCACGLHETLAQADPDLGIELPVCPVCAGLAQQLRALAADDEAQVKALGEKPAPLTPRPGDGRSIRVVHKSDSTTRHDQLGEAVLDGGSSRVSSP